MRYVASWAGQFTHIHVFGYWLGIAMDPTVVEVGLGRERCGLRSAYHGSPNLGGQQTANTREIGLLRPPAHLRMVRICASRTRSRSYKSGTMDGGSR